jgi:fibronectin-binding autotransporter adhesin
MKVFLLGLLAVFWSSEAVGQTLYTFNGGGTTGDWAKASTWTTDPTGSTRVAPRVPTTNDNVVITNSYVVQVNSAIATTGLKITIQRGGVLNLKSSKATFATINTLAGQGTLRIGAPYFPAVTTNNFDDANTGTVEYYNWGTTAALPSTAVQYNNLRLLNDTTTTYTAQLDMDLTLTGGLTLASTSPTATTPQVTFNLGKAATGRTLSVLGDITVGGATALGVSPVDAAHVLNAGGSFINNGTVNLHNGNTNDNQVALLNFTGATDANFACNGPTDLGRLQVNKGIDSQVLLNVTSTVNPNSPNGNLRLNYLGDGRILALVNGVAKFGNNIVLSKIHNGDFQGTGASSGFYDIGSSATSPTLWVAGASINNSNAKSINVYGTFRISAGSFTSLTPDAMALREDGQMLIEGGTTTVNKFRPSSTSSTHRGSFVITGGLFEVQGSVPFTLEDDFARFSIPYVTQSFRMTGGTIRVQNPSNGDGLFHIGANVNNVIVTGGTIEVILPTSTTVCRLSTTAPLWNLTIRKPAAGGSSIARIADIAVPSAFSSGATTAAQPLTVLNNFLIDGTNPTTFDANAKDVTIQGTLTIASGSTYLPGNNTTTFSGGQDQQLVNNGIIGTTANTSSFYNWVVNKSAGTLVLAGSVKNYTVAAAGTLSLLNGVLSDNGSTINVLGNMVNSATHTSGGGSGRIALSGTGDQTVSGNDTGVFGNLVIGSRTTGTVAMTANMSVTSQLTLSYVLDIGANRLSLTNVSNTNVIVSAGFSTTCMIRTAGNQSDLGLQKTYGGPQSFLFPVGTGTGTAARYAPATIALTLATGLARYGQVSVSPTNRRNPFVTNTNALPYYWKVRSTGFGPIPENSISATFRMTDSDATGTRANYIPAYYSADRVAWTKIEDVNQVQNLGSVSDITFATLNQFEGEFTAGETGAFGAVTAYYSRANGNWADKNTWSKAGFNGAAADNFPGANNPVFIGSATAKIYHTVTVAANAANSGSLVIDRGSIMDVGVTTGHNFGALPDAKIGGSGRLRVSTAASGTAPYTATFPGGDFGSFLQENGGTVEYYTTGTVDFTLPAASGTLSLNSYKNLWVNAATDRTITLPGLGLRIFSQLKTGTSAGTGLVLLSSGDNGNLRADSLIAVQAGTLRYPNGVARTITADTDVRIDASAKLDVSSAGTAVANALTIGGSLTNNGTLDFNLGDSRVVNLTFLGSQNTKFTGPSATLTDLYTLTLNKGLGQAATLSLDVAGTLTTPTNSWLTLTNGTLRYAKTAGTRLLTIHDALSQYLIPDNAGLTIDAPGATVTVATNATAPATNTSSASDLKLAGQLQVLQGTFNVGTTGVIGNDLEYASAGRPTIVVGTGGTLYVNGQIRRTTANTNGSLRYDQSGGTVEIRGARAEVYQNNERGLLEVQGPGSIFRMSGGTLALRGTNTRPTIIADLYLRPDSTVVSAGTVLLGNLVSGNIVVSVESLVPLYDMRVENGLNGTSTNTGMLTGISPLSLQGSLTIGNNNAYFNANGLPLNIDRDLINNNASTNTGLTNGGFRPGTATQTTTFTGKGPAVQQITSTLSPLPSNLTVFGGLVVNNAQTGGTLQLGRNVRTIGTLTIAKGTLADNGQTLTAVGDVSNSATHTSSGSGSLTLLGTVNQNIDGNGKGKFGNVILSNSAGATTLANQEITNVLTLTNGVLTIGSNLLALSNPASGAVAGTFGSTTFIRTNGIVADLGVRKSYPSGASSFLFPIGAAAKYTPVTMNVTANEAAGLLTVQPIDLAHPSTTDPAARELSFYWKVRSTGFRSPVVTQVFSYIDNGAGNDVNGTEDNYKLGRFVDGAWVPAAVAGVGGIANSVVSTGNNTLTNAGATYFDGDYTGGETSEFGTVPTFYSRNSTAGQAGGANWDSPSAWTNKADGSDPSPALTASPTLANPVVIRSGHLINAAANGNEAASLQLLGSLNLNTSTANNFNTVTGSGTVRIGSALFPAGNYSAFMEPTGGTVDYTAAVQLPARDTYNNLTFSGGNTKLLSNLDLTINGALAVAAGTTVNNPTNQRITLTSATSGATLAGTVNLSDGPLTTGAFLTTATGSTLNLGAGQVTIGTALTNGGALNNGSGAVAVGTAFANSGIYNATVGTGTLDVGTGFANNGSYMAGAGSLTVGGNFSNAAGSTFVANSGNVLVAGSFTNTGAYSVDASVSGNLLRVVGDFSNLASGSFRALRSTLVLRGNFVNNATASFNAGQGLVQFIADENRRLTGTTTFYNVQKVGANSLTLGASTNITVSNVLTLSNGLIVTGTSNTVSLTNSTAQPIMGTSTSAYVAGRLAITLPTAVSIRVFPVGLGGRYRPITLKTESASSAPQIILTEIINGAPSGQPDATLSNLSANRYYRIQRLSGGTLAPTSVQLSFNTDVEDEEVHVPGNLRVAQLKTDGNWGTAGGSGVFTPADPRGYTVSAASQTIVNTTSFFALASTNKVDNPLTGSAPLPVQLLSFTATRQGTTVHTAWATASEQNSSHFLVQRSADGRTFADVQQVAAQGNTLTRHDYATVDTKPLPGTSYYRLRQVDKDGTAVFSPVATVRFGDAQATPAPTLVAYPNPSAGQHFQVLASNLATTGGTVQLFDNVGRLVLTQLAAVGTAAVTIQPARPLASGLYLVTWQTADGQKLTTKVAVN